MSPGKGLREFLCVALPKVSGGVLTVAFNWLLLHHLGPAEFGVFALCVAGILLADGVIGSALDMGVLRLAPLYRETARARSYAIERVALWSKFALAGAAAVVISLFARPLSAALFHGAGHTTTLYLTCTAAVGMLLLRSVMVHLQVDRRFLTYGGVDLLFMVLKFGGVLVLVLAFQPDADSVLAIFAVAPLAAFGVGMLLSGSALAGSWRGHAGALGEVLGYVKWYLLTFGLAAALTKLDVFLLTLFGNIRQVGIFSGGYVFAFIPELIGMYLAVVLSPRVMIYLRDGRLQRFYRRVVLGLAAAGVLGYVLARLLMHVAAPVLLPPAFADSAEILLALLPGTLMAMVTFPLTVSYLMFTRPRFIFMVDVLTLPLVLALYYYAIREHGALGAAWATTISRTAKALVEHVAAWIWVGRPAPAHLVAGPDEGDMVAQLPEAGGGA